MLPLTKKGRDEPTILFLHFFGSSRLEWDRPLLSLARDFRCVSADLPGFGDAAQISGFSVGAMAIAVEKTIKSLRLKDFFIVGHSMSGKVALAVTARRKVFPLGLILIAPSPPGPEPISASGRKEMLSMKRDQTSAFKFLDNITAKPLTGNIRRQAVSDFVRCSPKAWRAWLEKGSRENWIARMKAVTCPLLVITGSQDPTLSARVQRRTTLKTLKGGRLSEISNCGHLPTLETPRALTNLIATFVSRTAYL